MLIIYILSLAALSAFDFIRYKDYVVKVPYFESYSYKDSLRQYFEDVRIIITDYKDYPLKTEEQKLQEVNKFSPNAPEDKKKVFLQERNTDYKDIKSRIDTKSSMKYYIKNKESGEIYTNLENVTNINDFIEKQAINVDEFPRSLTNDGSIESINRWFQVNNFEGKFIFLKTVTGFSQMEQNYKYYNSIRERVLKEGVLLIISLTAAAALFALLRTKLKQNSTFIQKIIIQYEKIPIDIRAFTFIIYSLIMLIYMKQTSFFYKPIGMSHIIKLSVIAVFIFYFIINSKATVKILQNQEEFSHQWKNSLCYQLWYLTSEGFKAKAMLSKVSVILVLTVFSGFFMFIGLYGLYRSINELILISVLYILIYMLFVPFYVLKRVVYLSKIIQGTEIIASGNLDYFIEEKGDKSLVRLVQNINRMKSSFKNSVENQLKSERLKTELITNVSHDLKTPLTSIINYVSLLKKTDVSEEQRTAYIEILDRKSQRLKVLIEDLFEASKVSSGAVELDIEEVDIASLLRQALGEFDEKISGSSLTFRVNIPMEELYLKLDGKRTWRVFENLIGNALKYSQPDSRVYINLVEKEDKVLIIMKNMSSYEMDFDAEEIFERFRRGDKARSTEGSGLGLSIAKSIVELQGGHMNIEIDGDLFKVTVEFKR
jgi:signal transduction histidine kinase